MKIISNFSKKSSKKLLKHIIFAKIFILARETRKNQVRENGVMPTQENKADARGRSAPVQTTPNRPKVENSPKTWGPSVFPTFSKRNEFEARIHFCGFSGCGQVENTS